MQVKSILFHRKLLIRSDSFILKSILLWPHSNLLASLKGVYLKKWCNNDLHQSQSQYQLSSGVQWKGRHKSTVLSLWGWIIAPILAPYNNDLHDRPVTVDEVTGGGFKARALMVKDNKYCHDKMRVEMTDGKRVFFPSQCHVCLLSNPSFFERVTEESKEVQLWLREEKGRKSLALALTGLFHNH